VAASSVSLLDIGSRHHACGDRRKDGRQTGLLLPEEVESSDSVGDDHAFSAGYGPAAGFHGWATHHGYANRCRLRRCNEASCVTGMQDPCAARERRSGTRTFAGPSPCVSVRRSARVMSVTSLLCVRAPSTVPDRSTVITVARAGSLANGCMLRRVARCSRGRLAARSTAFSLRY
jgi:hypothetical protein